MCLKPGKIVDIHIKNNYLISSQKNLDRFYVLILLFNLIRQYQTSPFNL